MEPSDFIYALLALIFVLALIGIMAAVAKRLGFGYQVGGGASKTRRLGLVETIPLDAKRRLVLLRRDDTEHLVILGQGSQLLIEGGIPAPGGDFAATLEAVLPAPPGASASPAQPPAGGEDRK